MPIKIAVTGASGHIGNVVCRMLAEKGHHVRALYHTDTRSLEGLPVEMVKGNVLNADDLDKLVDGCNGVVNCAAIISIDGDAEGTVFKTNTEGPRNVLKACLKKGVKRIIHVSSVHAVHDLPHASAYDESRTYKTADDFVYDYSKAEGEQIMLMESAKAHIDVIIVRPSSVLGPFDFKPSKIGKALMDYYSGGIPVVPKGGYDFVDVRDVAASVCSALTQGMPGEIYLLSGAYCTFKDLVSTIHQITHKKMPGTVVPFWMLKAAVPLVKIFSKIANESPSITYESIAAIQQGHPHMDCTKAKKVLGHNPRPLRESLEDFFNWTLQRKMNLAK